MMAKIEWYQEVLEQEPGSRVFFPLARLLEQVGRREEALVVLQNGVLQHPDFLEARLFLIQLLHELGQSAGCGAEVAKVANLFEAYPAFWDAWAEAAASVNRDLELAMRFMAATFRHPDISLCDVLASGLGCLSSEESVLEHSPQGRTAVLRATVSATEALPLRKPDTALPLQPEAVRDTPQKPETAAAPPFGAADVSPVCSTQDAVTASDTPKTCSADAEAALAFAGEGPVRLDAPELQAPFPTPQGQLPSFSFDDNEEDAGDTSEQDEPTLRTRSMADVLAEQGDFAGALEIYQELEASAPSPDEAHILHEHVLALAERLSTACETGDVVLEDMDDEETAAPLQAATPNTTDVPEKQPATTAGSDTTDSPSQKKLMSLLESLADRLEARART